MRWFSCFIGFLINKQCYTDYVLLDICPCMLDNQLQMAYGPYVHFPCLCVHAHIPALVFCTPSYLAQNCQKMEDRKPYKVLQFVPEKHLFMILLTVGSAWRGIVHQIKDTVSWMLHHPGYCYVIQSNLYSSIL